MYIFWTSYSTTKALKSFNICFLLPVISNESAEDKNENVWTLTSPLKLTKIENEGLIMATPLMDSMY